MGNLHEEYMYIYSHVSVNYSLNERFFIQMLFRKSKYTLHIQLIFPQNPALYEKIWKKIL